MANSLFIIKLFFFRYCYQIELVFFPEEFPKIVRLGKPEFWLPVVNIRTEPINFIQKG
ncbi:hypothetical protein FBBNIHIM_17745 [Pseudocitrobacter vendiensis]|uniref:Uncharacterized protein n=1 Tax=Pseudocitrobacter vendiensis TaxID=2488306 RepID=A0ABN8TDL2_9ENTR|nr:hypothetical protein FBBNIHIM_17745 [Pseudocitrobacter vendiensis]